MFNSFSYFFLLSRENSDNGHFQTKMNGHSQSKRDAEDIVKVELLDRPLSVLFKSMKISAAELNVYALIVDVIFNR